MLPKQFFEQICILEDDYKDNLNINSFHYYGLNVNFYFWYCKQVLGYEPDINKLKLLTKEELYKLYSFLWDLWGLDDLKYGYAAFAIFEFRIRARFAFKIVNNLFCSNGLSELLSYDLMQQTFVKIDERCEKTGEQECCKEIMLKQKEYFFKFYGSFKKRLIKQHTYTRIKIIEDFLILKTENNDRFPTSNR